VRQGRYRDICGFKNRWYHEYIAVPSALSGYFKSDAQASPPFYSGKHKKHAMNLPVIASSGGDIL